MCECLALISTYTQTRGFNPSAMLNTCKNKVHTHAIHFERLQPEHETLIVTFEADGRNEGATCAISSPAREQNSVGIQTYHYSKKIVLIKLKMISNFLELLLSCYNCFFLLGICLSSAAKQRNENFRSIVTISFFLLVNKNRFFIYIATLCTE